MDHLPTSARASARTMDELIIPALQEAGNALAVEQAHLVRDLLGFVADRAHLIGPRLGLQLRQAADLAESVRDAVLDACGEHAAPGLDTLVEALDAARREPTLATTDPDGGMELVDRLHAGVTSVVREVTAYGDAELARRLQRLVLVDFRGRIEVDRAWLAPMGFDPEPSTVTDLHALLGIRPQTPQQSQEER